MTKLAIIPCTVLLETIFFRIFRQGLNLIQYANDGPSDETFMQPQGAAVHNSVIRLALSGPETIIYFQQVASKSIKIYNVISDATINLVDKFFEMRRHAGLKALDTYKRAGKQCPSDAQRLDDAFRICGLSLVLSGDLLSIQILMVVLSGDLLSIHIFGVLGVIHYEDSCGIKATPINDVLKCLELFKKPQETTEKNEKETSNEKSSWWWW